MFQAFPHLKNSLKRILKNGLSRWLLKWGGSSKRHFSYPLTWTLKHFFLSGGIMGVHTSICGPKRVSPFGSAIRWSPPWLRRRCERIRREESYITNVKKVVAVHDTPKLRKSRCMKVLYILYGCPRRGWKMAHYPFCYAFAYQEAPRAREKNTCLISPGCTEKIGTAGGDLRWRWYPERFWMAVILFLDKMVLTILSCESFAGRR